MRKKLTIILITLSVIISGYFLINHYSNKDRIDKYDEAFERMLESVATILLVEDVDRSIEFYQKYFGFKLYNRFPTEGKATLAVVERNKLYVMFQDKLIFNEKKPEYIGGNISPSFSLLIDIDDAKKLYDQLKQEVDIVQELQLMFYNQYEFSVKDPDGYIITFSEDAKSLN